jgi:glycosyltransferase involved in cell wall biosynthesis
VRIAYLITRADAVGGASIHVRDVARCMRAAGHDAFVIVGGTGPVTDQLEAAGVPFHAVPSLQRAISPLRDWRALAEVKGLLRSLRPDLVSTHTAKAGWLGRAACARLGIPCLYTPHGWNTAERHDGPVGGLYTAAERVAARWATAIVCVCEYEREVALQLRIGRPEKLRVVYNGVADVAPELRARRWDAEPRVCCLARFEAPKDHVTLLRAMALLREEAWTLDLIGDGPQLEPMRRLAAELGIAGRVAFRGYLPQPERVMALAQMFVLSSRSEAFPRSILEAMRAGLPVVASDVGGVREAIDSVVPPGNVEALADAVRILLRSPEERCRRGEAMRRKYEQRFTLEHMMRANERLYANVLHRY